jgi:hypothetical protein
MTSMKNGSQSKFGTDMVRCDYLENIQKYCDQASIVNPSNQLHVIKDEPFKPLDADSLAVQIKPQRINVKLRPR